MQTPAFKTDAYRDGAFVHSTFKGASMDWGLVTAPIATGVVTK
jgi:hypothetical protein